MVSDEFDIQNPGKLTIRMKKITKNLQLSRQKTVRILRFFDEKAKNNSKKDVSFFANIGKVDVIINCKRLAKLCDNHTQKLLKDTSKLLQSKDEVTYSQRSKKKEVRRKKKEVSSREDTKECPYLKIIKMYHEILPMLPIVQNCSKDLKTRIKARWISDIQRQNLDWWKWYFRGVSKCDFLVGKVKDWTASFYWLTGPKNMTKVLNGEYVNRKKISKTDQAIKEFIDERKRQNNS